MEILVEQKKAGAGILEEQRFRDQMEWGGLVNNVSSLIEGIVIKALIYL